MPALRKFWATGYTVSLDCPFLSSASLDSVRIYQDGGIAEDMIDFVQAQGGHIQVMDLGVDAAPSSSDVFTTQRSPFSGVLHFKHFELESANWRTLVRVLSALRISSASFIFCCDKIPDENLHDFFEAVAHACGGILSPKEVMLRTHYQVSFWQDPITHPLVDGVRCLLPKTADIAVRRDRTYLGTGRRVPFGDPQQYQVGWSFANLTVMTVGCHVPPGIWPALAHSA